MCGKYNFDMEHNRLGSGSVKWDTGKRIFGGGDNFIPMWIADTDFTTLPEITEAITKRLAHPLFGYAVEPQAFFTSFVEWSKKRYGWDIEKDWICPADGVVNAIAILINALTNEGDGIVVQTPCYDSFYKVIEQNKRIAIKNELVLSGDDFKIDFADLEEKFKAGNKVMLFCNPHNPTGRVWTKDELKELVGLCKKYDVLIISDDIHNEIVYKGHQYTPIASIDEGFLQNAITCCSPGKTFNIAAIKSSTIIIADENKRKLFKDYQERMFQLKLNVLSYEASIAAYTHGEDYANELATYIEENARTACEFIEKNIPQIKPYMPQGTYLMLLDCNKLNLTGRELVSFFTKNAGVAFSGGNSYGENYSGWVRVNLGCSRSRLMQALEQIKSAF